MYKRCASFFTADDIETGLWIQSSRNFQLIPAIASYSSRSNYVLARELTVDDLLISATSYIDTRPCRDFIITTFLYPPAIPVSVSAFITICTYPVNVNVNLNDPFSP